MTQFEERHPIGSKARLAMALMLYTGQRRSDAAQPGRQHLKDGWLSFTQVKNRNRKPVRLSLPMVPELERIIAATPGTATTITLPHLVPLGRAPGQLANSNGLTLVPVMTLRRCGNRRWVQLIAGCNG